MASTMDLLKSGAAQQAAGQKLNSDTLGTDQSSSPSDVTYTGTEDDGEYVTASQSDASEEMFPGESSSSEDAQGDSSKAPKANAKAEQGKAPEKTSAKEVITITDEKGKRRIEVDLGDKEGLKKHIQMAYGARKWQAERDQARTESTQVKQQLSDLQNNWKALEDAYSNGIEGLVDLLEGRRGAFKEWESRRLERHELLKSASPEERENFEMKERLQKMERDEQRRAKEYDDRVKRIEDERNQIDLKAAESKIHPVFDRYRFSEKLGDKDAEQMFDEMLWSTAMQRLEPYESEYGSANSIPNEIVNQVFRDVAGKVRSRISGLAEKKASKAIEQKKKEATENVQAKVMSGYQTGGTAKEAADLIKNGNLTGLLKNWGKYKSVFNR